MITRDRFWITSTLLITFWLIFSATLIVRHELWEFKFFVLISILFLLLVVGLHHFSQPQKKLRDLALLTQRIKQLSPNHLERISSRGLSPELSPIIDSLNHFLDCEADQTRVQNAFTSEASHELRTPLAGIRLQTQIAQRTKDPEQREKALMNILHAVDRSTDLVEQLLTLSRLTMSEQVSKHVALSINQLVAEITENYRTELDSQGIQLQIIGTEASVQGNRSQLQIFIQNILSNAIKYTPPNGKIQIYWQPVNDVLSFTIEDSGAGVNEADYNDIQRPFQKGPDSKKQGFGLGLAIAKRTAELHNSPLILESAKLGGLSVTIKLPLYRSNGPLFSG